MPRMRTQMAQVDYMAILEGAWQQHLEERKLDAPTLISTFAGCGGSSLGYSMAGFRELLAVEWDDNAVATFKLNFPDVPVYHGDIHKLTVEKCLEMIGLQPGEIDLLDGSPPCQGFSTAGKRKMEDKRNQLYMEFIRLLRGLRPKVFVMENVSGLVKGKMKLVFADIMQEMKASGYRVRCKLLNAMYFQVPQSRQRLIWIGVRDDLGIEVSFPKAEHRPITAGQAIVGADSMPLGRPTLAVRNVSRQIRPGEGAGKYTKHGTAFSVIRLDERRPAPTLTKSLAGMSGIMQPTGDSYLSAAQIKRLASYPGSFRLMGAATRKWACIGNSVPPLFMRAIAKHIRTEILKA